MVLICKFDDLWQDYFVIVIINSEFSFKFQTMMRNYEMKNLIRVYYKTNNLLLCLLLPADYMLKVGVSNFRNAWESMGDEWQQIDNSKMHGKALVIFYCKLTVLFTNNCIMPSSIDGLKSFATNDFYIC